MLLGIADAGLVGVSQFRALFYTLREGKPFVPANAQRIRRIAG